MKNLTRFIAILLVMVAGHSVPAQTDPREGELKALGDAIKVEQDRGKRDGLNKRISVLWTELAKEKAAALHERWKNETDPEEKKKLVDDLVVAAVHSDQPDLVTEVATNGTFAQKEIKIPAEVRSVRLRTLQTFPYEERPFFNGEPSWIVRRMTSDRFELWTSKRGWLFDRSGDVLTQAIPPRRDGLGREWYGAFLPDGRWVTTDLWSMDCTLSFFSRKNKWIKEIRSTDLVPRGAETIYADFPALIGWCRCDRSGKSLVLSVGANGGWGLGTVDWSDHHRVLKTNEQPWQLCYPRDLEPKGMYTQLYIPNDSGRQMLHRGEHSHGMFVGFPTYYDDHLGATIPEGDRFGYWPGSDATYVVCGRWEAIDPPQDVDRAREAAERTWFFGEDGMFAGWLNAGRIADTAKQDGMLFRDVNDRVVTLSKSYAVTGVDQFVWSDETHARPFKLFPDLRLGFFVKGKELVLAKWATAKN